MSIEKKSTCKWAQIFLHYFLDYDLPPCSSLKHTWWTQCRLHGKLLNEVIFPPHATLVIQKVLAIETVKYSSHSTRERHRGGKRHPSTFLKDECLTG